MTHLLPSAAAITRVWRFHRLLLVLFLATVAGETGLGQTSTPSLRLEPSQIDLGSVGHGQKQIVEFSVVNLTKMPQQLSGLRPTCGCMKIISKEIRTPLGPGEKRAFSFSVNFGRGWGKFAKTIEIQMAQIPVLRLPVVAKYHPGITTSARELVLATSTAGAIPEQTAVVEFTSAGELPPSIDKLTTSDSHFTATLLESKGNRAFVSVSAGRGIDNGRFSGRIDGFCNGLPFTVPIRGRSFGNIVHDPQHWNLKQIKDSGFSEKVLKLRRVDGKDLELLSTTLELTRGPEGLDISFSSKKLADGSLELRAYIADPYPETPGAIFGKLKLSLNTDEKNPLIVDLLGIIRPKGSR